MYILSTKLKNIYKKVKISCFILHSLWFHIHSKIILSNLFIKKEAIFCVKVVPYFIEYKERNDSNGKISLRCGTWFKYTR